MAQQTEAACLLSAGTAYRKRALLHPEPGGDVFLGVKAGGYSLYRDDEPIVHFDFEGRWLRAFLDGVHYLKGLDTSIRSIDRVREGEALVLRRRTLADAEVATVDARVRADLLDLIANLDAGRFVFSDRGHDAQALSIEAIRDLLGRSAAWDAPAWSADRDRYRAAYGPLPFLPPTCPNPLILQANSASGFGRAAGFRPVRRTVADFGQHLGAVGRLVGRRLASCRNLFLDGLDPLGGPPEEVLEILAAAVDRFPIGSPSARSAEVDELACPMVAVQAMLDDFPEVRPGLDYWASLRALGLKHLTLGIESGDPDFRASYGKSWGNGQLGPILGDLRAAGIASDLVVLIGPGGKAGAESHVRETGRLIGSLPPSSARRLYLVDARSFQGAPELESPLDDRETAEQASEIQAGLSGEGRPTIVIYNPDKQPI